MPWAVDAEVKAGLAAALKRADGGAGFPAYMDDQIARAVGKAQGQIRNVLTDSRRFSEAQLLAWHLLYTVHYDQSLFNCEVYLREAFKDAAGDLLSLKDWRDDLLTISLGVVPELPAVGVSAGHGGLLTFRQRYEDEMARYGRWCRW